MAEPTTEEWRTLTGDEAVADALAHSAQADGCIDRALAADAARRLRFLSRQNEELRKALEQCVVEKVRALLSCAPSPSETEKSE